LIAETAAPALGFPRQEYPARTPVAQRPTALPRRPKGRWLVFLLVATVAGLAGHAVWNAYFRYRAYGVVQGHLVKVPPPWEGVLRDACVREGDAVRQGELLLVLDSLALRQRQAQLGDELELARASLGAEAARLKWQSAFNLDQTRGALALYYDSWGDLLREEARLDDLRVNLRRAERLLESQAVAQEEVDNYRFATRGQEARVAKLTRALADLKRRAEQADALLRKDGELSAGLEAGGYEQLKPSLVRVETLAAERARLQERLDQGQVRSPANGRVVTFRSLPGEYYKAGDTLLTVLEEGSLEIVLYLPQDLFTSVAVGDELPLTLDPYPEPLPCRVRRLGDQLEPAPESLKRYYREGQRLLPVYLAPTETSARWAALRVGGTVKLPGLRIP
jgi:multidrug resistance efflux pump